MGFFCLFVCLFVRVHELDGMGLPWEELENRHMSLTG